MSTSRHNIILITTPPSRCNWTSSCRISYRYVWPFCLSLWYFASPQHKHLQIESMRPQCLMAFLQPVFIFSLHYLNWLTGQNGPELAVQIKIYLGDPGLVGKADCCSAGIYWGEIILHFLMTYLVSWLKKNSDSAFFSTLRRTYCCHNSDEGLKILSWKIESRGLMKEKVDPSLFLLYILQNLLTLLFSSCLSRFTFLLPLFPLLSFDLSFPSCFLPNYYGGNIYSYS